MQAQGKARLEIPVVIRSARTLALSLQSKLSEQKRELRVGRDLLAAHLEEEAPMGFSLYSLSPVARY